MKYVFTIIVYVFIAEFIFSQENDNDIVAIREKVLIINSDSLLQTKIFHNDEFLNHNYDGGGQLTCYSKDDILYKICAEIYLSYGKVKTDYYLWNGNLIFAYDIESNYQFIDSSFSYNYKKLNLVYEARYYIKNNKLIKNVLSGKRLISMEKDDKILESLFNDVTKYSKCFLRKK